MLEPGYGAPASGKSMGEQGLGFLTWADLVSTEAMMLATQSIG